MPTKMIDVSEAQSQLKELVSLAGSGTEVILTEGAKAVARLLAVGSSRGRRTPGLHRGSLQASNDFDDPLPEGFWAGKQ